MVGGYGGQFEWGVVRYVCVCACVFVHACVCACAQGVVVGMWVILLENV